MVLGSNVEYGQSSVLRLEIGLLVYFFWALTSSLLKVLVDSISCMARRWRCVVPILALVSVTPPAWAASEDVDDKTDTLPEHVSDFPKDSIYRTLTQFEWSLTRRVLEEEGVWPDQEAEGKEICEIHYSSWDIFLPEESFPVWLNKGHVRTKIEILKHRVPIHQGDEWTALLREEARKQIDDLKIYAVAAIVPVQHEDPGCIRVEVVTRDRWSITPDVDPKFSGGILESFEGYLVESNLLGTNNKLGVGFLLERGSWEIGPMTELDWLGGKNLKIAEEPRVIFDREFGGYEGISNTLRMERPLRTYLDKQGWYADTTFRTGRGRVFDKKDVLTHTYQDTDTGKSYTVDERWDELKIILEAAYMRSWGRERLHRLTTGAFMDLLHVNPAPMDDTIPDSVLDQLRQERLPRAERGLGPFVEYEYFQNSFFYIENYDTYGVSESYRPGFHFLARIRYSEPGLGANIRFTDATVGASYLLPFGADGFVDVGTMGRLRWDPSGVVDRRFEAATRLVTPTGLAGRFVYHGWVRLLDHDTSNTRFRLGATEGLRGVSGFAAEGRNAWTSSIEWRSKPWEVLSIYLGFAAFLDAGSAWERGDDRTTHMSVGFGIRIMPPQLISAPVSIDFGWPTDAQSWSGKFPMPAISVRYGQQFNPVNDLLDIDEFWH